MSRGSTSQGSTSQGSTVASRAALALLLVACGDDAPPDPTVRPEILEVRVTAPQTQGTRLRVVVANLDTAGDSPRLAVALEGDAPFNLTPELPIESDEVRFPLSSVLVSTLGAGNHAVTLRILGDGDLESEPFDFTLRLAEAIPISLTRVPSGDVGRGQLAVLEGDGFLEPGEGTVEARFSGSFTADAGGTEPVDAIIPVTIAEFGDRTRGLVRLGTELGGVAPGTFTGSVELESVLAFGGAPTTSATLDTTLRFGPPQVFSVEPMELSLEQLVRVRGSGFLGAEDDEVTLLRAEGTFAPQGGGPVPVGPAELVLAWASDEELIGPVAATVMGDRLVAELFGVARGRFEGTLTPVVLAGDTEVAGSPAPVTLVLGPIRQVIWMRFLPGFYDSLARFGLAAAAGVIEQKIQERIEGIFADWNVEVRLERPEDFSPQGYSVVEIGGPDPNGRGLFGYDNTPGKDINNLRLFDAIGGANAETQMDGFPGYGGVFVESFFGFSEHPPPDVPDGGPDPDPLFDEIFDEVRDTPATLAEVRGEGDRSAVVRRAVDSFAAMVGETSAHEIGHSLGLADPFGSERVFHNAGDGPGCLMDSGGARPFGERVNEPGFSDTRLCGENATYLDGILGD